MNKPRYNHDCGSCVFLGNYEKFDIYHCPTAILHTIVIRESSDPGDYYSLPIKYIENMDEDTKMKYNVSIPYFEGYKLYCNKIST